jgi:hypothetical protein
MEFIYGIEASVPPKHLVATRPPKHLQDSADTREEAAAVHLYKPNVQQGDTSLYVRSRLVWSVRHVTSLTPPVSVPLPSFLSY